VTGGPAKSAASSPPPRTRANVWPTCGAQTSQTPSSSLIYFSVGAISLPGGISAKLDPVTKSVGIWWTHCPEPSPRYSDYHPRDPICQSYSSSPTTNWDAITTSPLMAVTTRKCRALGQTCGSPTLPYLMRRKPWTTLSSPWPPLCISIVCEPKKSVGRARHCWFANTRELWSRLLFGSSWDLGRIIRGGNQGRCARATWQISQWREHPTVDPPFLVDGAWRCTIGGNRAGSLFGVFTASYRDT
jgi:hypothetical protein